MAPVQLALNLDETLHLNLLNGFICLFFFFFLSNSAKARGVGQLSYDKTYAFGTDYSETLTFMSL